MELNLRHIAAEKKLAQEMYTRKNRDKDRELRALKKSELQLKNAKDAVLHSQQVYAKVKSTASVACKSL